MGIIFDYQNKVVNHGLQTRVRLAVKFAKSGNFTVSKTIGRRGRRSPNGELIASVPALIIEILHRFLKFVYRVLFANDLKNNVIDSAGFFDCVA